MHELNSCWERRPSNVIDQFKVAEETSWIQARYDERDAAIAYCCELEAQNTVLQSRLAAPTEADIKRILGENVK